MQLKNFLKLAFGVGAIGMLDRVVLLAIGIILARWLGAEGYGTYALAMASMTLALLVVRAGLPDWLLREVAVGRGDASRDLGSGLIKRILVVVMGMGVVWALVGTAATLLFVSNPDLAAAFLVAAWLLPVTAVLDTVGNALRGMGKAVQAQFLTALFLSLLVLLGVFTVASIWAEDGHAAMPLLVRIVAFVVVITLGLILLFRSATPARPKRVLPGFYSLLRSGGPFLLIGGAAVLLSRTDVLMLGAFAGPRAAGVYNVAAQGAMLVPLVLNIGNTVSAPEYSRLFAIGDRAGLERFAIMSARSVLAVGFVIALCLSLFAEPLLGFVFGSEFAEASDVLVILSLGFWVSFVFGETGFMLSMTGHEKDSMWIMITAAVCNIALNFALIPLLGAEGAALATVISLNTQRAVGWWTVRKRLGISCGCLKI